MLVAAPPARGRRRTNLGQLTDGYADALWLVTDAAKRHDSDKRGRQLRISSRAMQCTPSLLVRHLGGLGVFDLARSADEGMRLADETGQRVWAGTAQLAVAFIDAGGWDFVTACSPRHASALVASVDEMTNGFAAVGTEVVMDYSRAVLADDADAKEFFSSVGRSAVRPERFRGTRRGPSWPAVRGGAASDGSLSRATGSWRLVRFRGGGAKPCVLPADHELRPNGGARVQSAADGSAQLSP